MTPTITSDSVAGIAAKAVCECGDYYDQHLPGGGTCIMNGLGHGFPGGHCYRFRLAGSEAAPPDASPAESRSKNP